MYIGKKNYDCQKEAKVLLWLLDFEQYDNMAALDGYPWRIGKVLNITMDITDTFQGLWSKTYAWR